MVKKLAVFIGFITIMGVGHLTVKACMCSGVNPDIYPPDMKKVKKYYRTEFKGAAFTGEIVSIKVISGESTSLDDKVLEVTVEVDRAWLGVGHPEMRFYTSDNPCGIHFKENESYFFIPTPEKGRLYIAPCTYASYSSKSDGNYVDLMVAVFGKGKKFRRK